MADPQSQVGQASEKGERNENQDEILVSTYPLESGDSAEALILGVLDGHGSSGKICASTTRDMMKKALGKAENLVIKSMAQDEEETFTSEVIKLFNDLQLALQVLTQDKSNKVNAKFSGTTVALALIQYPKIYCANVGDSDVILGRLINGALETKALSIRHQLNIDSERDRIVEAGGRVERQKTRAGQSMTGPLRVWLKEIQTPGLMVSRSIGDIICHEIGVIADPDVSFHKISPAEDTVVILGSDGLWEFVTPIEAVEFTEDFLDPNRAAYGLAQLALSRQTSKTADNVSVVVYFLEKPPQREARLLERGNYQVANAAREKQIEDCIQAIAAPKDEDLQKAIKADQDTAGSIVYGSNRAKNNTMYGEPMSVAAGSIIDDGEEYEQALEEKADNATPAGKESKACVIL